MFFVLSRFPVHPVTGAGIEFVWENPPRLLLPKAPFLFVFCCFGLKTQTPHGHMRLQKQIDPCLPGCFGSVEQTCTFKTVVWEQVLGVRPGCKWSHNTPTANNTEVKRLALPGQTHAPQMTTSLWMKETVSACVIVCCQWRGVGGHLGFLQGAKQMQSGRFTSPSRQAGRINSRSQLCDQQNLELSTFHSSAC